MEFLDKNLMKKDCKCEDCALYKQTTTNYCLPGRFADITKERTDAEKFSQIKFIAIGEAPGKHEDINGYCFAHTSGENLHQAFGEDFKYVYLTNICRCTPYDPTRKQGTVRAPTPVEMECCGSWILKELSYFPPEIPIILFGNTALKFFFPDSQGVTSEAGLPRQFIINDTERTLIPNVHPASIAYNAGLKKTFFSIVSRIRTGNLDPEYIEDPNTMILHPRDGVKYLDKVILLYNKGLIKYVIYDSETTSLDPHAGHIIMLGFCDPRTRKGITIPTHIMNTVHNNWRRPTIPINMEVTSADISILQEKTRELFATVPIVGHNIKFDIKFAAIHQYLDPNKVRVYNDTLSMMSVIVGRAGTESLSLKESAARLCKVDTWEGEIEQYLSQYRLLVDKHYGSIPTCILYKYCGRDVYYNLLLHEELEAKVPETGTDISIDNLNRCTELFALAELNGIAIDNSIYGLMKETSDEALDKLKKEILKDPKIKEIGMEKMNAELEANAKKLKKDGTPNQHWKDPAVFKQKFVNGEYYTINSVKDKRELLNRYGIITSVKTKKDEIATSKEALEEIMVKYADNKDIVRFCQLYLQYNKFSKLKSTYIDGLYSEVWEDGNYHSEFKINGTVTGRMSSGFHTLPRASSVKRLFISKWKDQGGLFSGSDMSQLELRVTAAVANEPAWIKAYEENKDLHQITASNMFNIPFDEVTKEQRTIGKCVTGDTLIETDRGSVRIEELVGNSPNDEVVLYLGDVKILTIDGYKPIERIYRRENTEIVEVMLEDGKALGCTPHHEFVIGFNNNSPIFKEAKHLNIGSEVLVLSENNVNPKFKPVKVKKVYVCGHKETVYDIVEPVHRLFITNGILTKDTENFSILYQSGVESQAIKLKITVEEAQEMLDKYKGSIPQVMKLIERQKEFARANGYIINMFNRRMPIPEAKSNKKGEMNHGFRQSFNFLIQSSASQLVIYGLAKFYEELQKRKMKSRILGAVHDSIEADIYPGEAIDFYRLIKYCFETYCMETLPWLICPMRIDLDMGTSWGSCIEMEDPIITEDFIKFEGSGMKNDILALAETARKAYNFDYKIIKQKELTEKDFTLVDLVRDTEKWTIKAILSKKKS